MSRPAFLVLSPDGDALAEDLRRRYAADYEVLGEDQKDKDVALLLVDERIPDAIDVLNDLRAKHPGAKRVLLVGRGDWSSTHPAINALALGRIDYHLYVPWRPLERILYAAVGEFLAA
ncbi:hypothetical protein AB0M20_25495, partial [Actinoplanes sp. NPDC051633]|uniref:hypothetical protein n=1 Tax=Actinoplanes sp. NPDC051633 TaxID=3155670 RepID=UPI00344A06C7